MNKPPTGVLILPGWERGFCPLHCCEREKCNLGCIPARRAMVELVADYRRFWLGLPERGVAA